MIVIARDEKDSRFEEVVAGLKGEFAKAHIERIEKSPSLSLFAISLAEKQEQLFVIRTRKRGEGHVDNFLFSVDTGTPWDVKMAYGYVACFDYGDEGWLADPLLVLLDPVKYANIYQSRKG